MEKRQFQTTRFYFEQALLRIKETCPEATMDCIPTHYSIGYWNGEESFINEKGAWEYPGTWYPAPMNISDDEMIELLTQEGLKVINSQKQ